MCWTRTSKAAARSAFESYQQGLAAVPDQSADSVAVDHPGVRKSAEWSVRVCVLFLVLFQCQPGLAAEYSALEISMGTAQIVRLSR
jgi:hypothetical protein